MVRFPGPSTCVQCSSPIEQASAAVRLYCSTQCRSRAAYLARKAGLHLRPRHSSEERFAALIDVSGPLSLLKGAPGRCHLWTGCTTASGYGKFKLGGKTVRAHRFAYQQRHGPIMDGLVVDHLCRVPLCVNVAHLEAVTNRENILRGTGTSALNARMTHCSNGHPLTFVSDQRRCVTCRTARSRERAAERRQGTTSAVGAANQEMLF
ncbi:HNH endonuclease signature motif containing protein [Kitasatospora purpeofusca]|uniref:HNH endonuclease signature motif containing protein n=1 Tax=Kitasatospora purpeofusca TaxID=67352 RepID=UPI0035D65F05